MAKRKFRVELEFLGVPVSKSNAHNAAWSRKLKRCVMYVPAKIRNYEKALHTYAMQFMKSVRKKATTGLIKIDLTYYYGSKRTKDLLNLPKSTADALEKAVFKNDFQIHEAHIYRKLDRLNPRVHIIVEEMSDKEWETG